MKAFGSRCTWPGAFACTQPSVTYWHEGGGVVWDLGFTSTARPPECICQSSSEPHWPWPHWWGWRLQSVCRQSPSPSGAGAGRRPPQISVPTHLLPVCREGKGWGPHCLHSRAACFGFLLVSGTKCQEGMISKIIITQPKVALVLSPALSTRIVRQYQTSKP